MPTNPKLTWEPVRLQLRTPFRIAHGVDETRIAHWIRLKDDSGWGEGTIPPYYGISNEEMAAVWRRAAQSAMPFPERVEDIPTWVGEDGPAPARCALELALLDRLGKQNAFPLYRLLHLPEPKASVTSFTIGIDTPESMAEQARKVPQYPVIKVKLGSEDDEARISAIRKARPDACLRVDANAGWSLPQALDMVKRLAVYDLEMIEQPLPREQIAEMGEVQAATSIPVVADESVQTLADVHALGKAGVKGINLKLMKVGGILKGLEMVRASQIYGMRLMLGCMVETSLGVTAMAHLSGLAEWVDLDPPLLVSNDPFDGIFYDSGLKIGIPLRNGIGVTLRD